ncbi:MAG: exodeoxyribonuclease VII large subunit [Acidobacteria bacterium]|nr:exodeoxyribonuclease VII large subunit [Acidobacteriota bacterium]
MDLTRREYSVSELTAEIGELLGDAYSNIWVSGEVSGLKTAASGHAYFTLKDDKASLRCACWKGAYRLLRFKPKDGMEVLARGRIEVYEPRGEYQLIVDALEPLGAGALQLAFEQLKKKLADEGLFAEERKRPIPKLPKRIGVVTSPTGAVIRDILHVIERRFPGLHIRLYPALVQGAGAVEQVTAGIRYFSENPWADVVILARGGGSIEDLWTFNEEAVARAIAGSAVPVLSAIGHETDFTIADFVSDLRAPTPSAAAEIVTSSRELLLEQISIAKYRMTQATRFRLNAVARKLDGLSTSRAQMTIERRLFRAEQRLDDLDQQARESILHRLRAERERLSALTQGVERRDLRLRLAAAQHRNDALWRRMETLIQNRLRADRTAAELAGARLNSLNPLQILARGFAVVTNPAGEIVRLRSQAAIGSTLRIRLADGELGATVDSHPNGQ